ncbi:MAG TPA: FkbM family methyltransferase [Thermoanaerobaculia bacterium]
MAVLNAILGGRKRGQTNVRSVPSGIHTATAGEAFRQPFRAAAKLIDVELRRRSQIAMASIADIMTLDHVHVVDIGAADGIHERWQLLGERLLIDLFEPEHDAFVEMTRMYAGQRTVRCFETALSENGGEIELTVTRWPRAATCLTLDSAFLSEIFLRDHFEVTDTIRMPSRRLDDVLAGEDIDFIKADVEGMELPILRGAGALMDTCIGVEAEVIYGKSAPKDPLLFSDMDAYCRSHGLTLTSIGQPGYWHFALPSEAYESKGFIVNGDALFLCMPALVVDRVNSGAWPARKVAAAAALYLTYGNFELVYVLAQKAHAGGILTKQQCTGIERTISRLAGAGRRITYGGLHRLAAALYDYDSRIDF